MVGRSIVIHPVVIQPVVGDVEIVLIVLLFVEEGSEGDETIDVGVGLIGEGAVRFVFKHVTQLVPGDEQRHEVMVRWDAADGSAVMEV